MKKQHHNTVHGLSYTREYNIWKNIRQRCYSECHESYRFYGAVGVKMSPLWVDNPKAFIDWVKENNCTKGMHVCRKRDEGDYTPENCYIGTPKQNNRDKKSVILNEWKARVIRVMAKNHGWTHQKQADFWGVAKSTISGIVTNRRWV